MKPAPTYPVSPNGKVIVNSFSLKIERLSSARYYQRRHCFVFCIARQNRFGVYSAESCGRVVRQAHHQRGGSPPTGRLTTNGEAHHQRVMRQGGSTGSPPTGRLTTNGSCGGVVRQAHHQRGGSPPTGHAAGGSTGSPPTGMEWSCTDGNVHATFSPPTGREWSCTDGNVQATLRRCRVSGNSAGLK